MASANAFKAWAAGLSAASAAEQVNIGMDLLVNAAAGNQLQLLKHAIEFQGVPVDILLQWAPPGRYPRRRTLLQIAANAGCIETVHYLLCKGADPDARSPDDGFTALHCAAESGHSRTAEIIAIVLSYGGHRDALDLSGRRPVDLLSELIDNRQGALFGNTGEVGEDVPGLLTGPSELDKDEYKTDEFRMYCFKVAKCSKCRAHDWTECPFAHPGEKARRRDPTKYSYSGSACPDFRKGSCKRGDSCQFAHGVFECWLHPNLYRTQLCKDAPMCTRRVCFFAHSLEELRQPTEFTPGEPCAAPPSLVHPSNADSADLSSASSTPSSSPPTPDNTEDSRPKLHLAHAASLSPTLSSLSSANSSLSSGHSSADNLGSPEDPGQSPLMSYTTLASMLQQMGAFGLPPAASAPMPLHTLSLPHASAPMQQHLQQQQQHSLLPQLQALQQHMGALDMGGLDAAMALKGMMMPLPPTSSAAPAASAADHHNNPFAMRTGSYEAFDQWIDVLTDDTDAVGSWPGVGALNERAACQGLQLQVPDLQVPAM